MRGPMQVSLDFLVRRVPPAATAVVASCEVSQRRAWADFTPTPSAAGALSPSFMIGLSPKASFITPSTAASAYGRTSVEISQSMSDATSVIDFEGLRATPKLTGERRPCFAIPEVSPTISVAEHDGSFVTVSASTPSVAIKNTFIHVEETDSCDGFALFLPPRSISAPNVFGDEEDCVPSTSPKANLSPTETQNGEALLSFGSSLHADRSCRPCAWFWKHQGCSNGVSCRHCHLCPQGEIKRRRKNKFIAMRNERLATSAAGGSPRGEYTASDSEESPAIPE